MPTKYLTEPVTLSSFSDDTLFSTVGLDREPVIDRRNGQLKLRVMDGITPGGRAMGNGMLNVVMTPTIAYPIDQSENVSIQPILRSSAFTASGSGTHTHVATRWQLSKVADFSIIAYDSGYRTTPLEYLDLFAISVELDFDTEYYARVMYKSNDGFFSEWSDAVNFRTRVFGLTGNEVTKLLPSNGTANLGFYRKVALSYYGTRAAVGAVDGNGAVYIYDNTESGWVQSAILYASDGASGDYFGDTLSFSADGNRLAIGATNHDVGGNSNAGAVYIFDYVNGVWTETTKLVSPVPSAEAIFGVWVQFNTAGNRLFVSSYKHNGNNGRKGAVFVFDKAGEAWNSTMISHPESVADDWFGYNISCSDDGNTLATSAIYRDDEVDGSGKVYIYKYENSAWTCASTIMSSTPLKDDWLGISLSLSGDGKTLVTGSYRTSANVLNASRVHVFVENAGVWSEEAQIISPSAYPEDRFGRFVSTGYSGDVFVASDMYDDTRGADAGAVYVYTRSNGVWSMQRKILGSEIAGGHQFGYAPVLSRNEQLMIAGSPYDSTMGLSCGAAYIFR